MRHAILALLALAVLALPACSTNKPQPLREMHPRPGTFTLTLSTNVMDAWGGRTGEVPVNHNVLAARRAIEVLVAKGYRYSAGMNEPAYVIHVDMMCYDPKVMATMKAQDEAFRMLEPVILDPMAEEMERGEMSLTWYQSPGPGAGKPESCAGRIMLSVRGGGAEGRVFQGRAEVPGCAHEAGCPYGQCAERLTAKLERVLGAAF